MKNNLPIPPLYLSRDEIGPFMAMSEKKARALLEKYGIKPVDMGKGRGNGLRWRTAAVIDVADTLHMQAQNSVTVRRSNIRKKHPLRNHTAEEIYAEYMRDSAVTQ